jgi:ATP-dependent 26S proteasome regulatory subunit
LTKDEIDEILSGQTISHPPTGHQAHREELGGLLETIRHLETRIAKRTALNWETKAPPALERLCHLFRLTPFEKDVLVVCLAPEVHRRYDKLYAYLQDDVTRKRPSVDLVLNLLCHSFEERITGRGFFHCDAPLVRYQMLSFVNDDTALSVPLLSRFIKLDDRIVDFILQQGGDDAQLKAFVQPVQEGLTLGDLTLPEPLKAQLFRLVEGYRELQASTESTCHLQCFIHGPYGSGKREAAAAVCHQLGLPLLEARVEALIQTSQMEQATIQRICREALLRGAGLVFTGMEHLLANQEKLSAYHAMIHRAVRDFPGPLFLASQRPWIAGPGEQVPLMTLEFPAPDFNLRKRLWQVETESNRTTIEAVDLDEIANQFRFTGGQIRDAMLQALHLNQLEKGNHSRISRAMLYQGCRRQCNQKLSELSQKIIPHYSWTDIVLPEDRLAQLREICDHVRYRHLVFGDWGFEKKMSLGKGLTVLFAGPSGTGKTMAAEIIAGELQIDLYKIDLSCVVSKYIGETEKNLSKVFREAEQSNAILLFDEADALFGKRSEVKDSHDRYANIEVNYLLQKMEEFDGIVILATNIRGHIDDAFIRRLRFCVEFPFPDETSRCRIWKGVFPETAPQGGDIDFHFLASRFKLSGGNIKNIALASAFLAARNSGKIGMDHVILATKREFQKMGKICTRPDFGKYYDLVTGEG